MKLEPFVRVDEMPFSASQDDVLAARGKQMQFVMAVAHAEQLTDIACGLCANLQHCVMFCRLWKLSKKCAKGETA